MRFIGPEDGCPEENLQHKRATQIFGTYRLNSLLTRMLILLISHFQTNKGQVNIAQSSDGRQAAPRDLIRGFEGRLAGF
jgi:hypothetical protein